MLFRLLWHAGRYRIPEVLDMTVLDCAIALGVDQIHKPNRPFGAPADPEPAMSVNERLKTPTGVMVDPGLLASAMEFASA